MRYPILILVIALSAAGAFAQVTNDSCATAVSLTIGTPTPGTNIGATTGPDPVASCGAMQSDAWFGFVPICSGTYTATTCHPGTTFDTVIAAWDGTNGCGASLVPLGCNDDGCSGTSSVSSTVTFQANALGIYYISVGGYFGATGSFMVSVSPGGSGIALSFFNVGPGTIGFSVSGGAAFGQYLTVMTLNQGAYPNGWFFGIDVLQFELQFMLNFGYPFSGSLDPCGSFAFGPIGAPPGLGVYAVVLGFPVGSQLPSAISSPVAAVIP